MLDRGTLHELNTLMLIGIKRPKRIFSTADFQLEDHAGTQTFDVPQEGLI